MVYGLSKGVALAGISDYIIENSGRLSQLFSNYVSARWQLHACVRAE